MADFEDRDQKTEEATPRRREEARSKGQVALSQEFVAAVGLAGGLVLLLAGGTALLRVTADGLAGALASLGALGSVELDATGSAALIRASLEPVLGVLAAVIVPTALVGALAGYAQVGFRFSPQAVEADAGKLDPLRGLRRVFSARSAVRAAFAGVKILLITGAAAIVAWIHVDDIVRVGTNEVGPILRALGTVSLRATAAALAVIVFLGLIDVLFQRFQHERDLRMSKREVKEEHRLTEGDPHVRARIRSIQRELALRRMMSEVPRSTVVVTNPSHYAVALRYEREERAGPVPPGTPGSSLALHPLPSKNRPGGSPAIPGEDRRAAPVVVAKGLDHLAQRIKEVAGSSGVVCYEDVSLARALYAKVRVGQQIPEELYGAVAAVLAHVYRLKGLAEPA
jgi:flagellar biosynthetic protein FlhB